MRTTRVLAATVALALLVSAPLQAAERIKGAALFIDGAKLGAIYPKFFGLPFDQGEVDLFLGNTDKVIAWAAAHRTEWSAVDEADDTFTAIRDLALWETMEIGSNEFVAMFIKLKIAQELESGGIDVAMLREQVQFMRNMLVDPDRLEELKAETKKQLEMLDEMISGLDNYPEGNRSTYTTNKERIDDAISRFEAATKTDTATPNDG